ncbi:MAG: YhjD/YihY/BrkB family envelope integrity protein [Kineosporiaceae bacterium]
MTPSPPPPAVPGAVRATGAAVRHDLWAAVRGRDLGSAAAVGTFQASLTVVPSLLVAVAFSGLLIGEDGVLREGGRLAAALPAPMGAPAAVRAVLAAGLRLPWWGVLFAVIMASAYGAGLSRCLLPFSPRVHRAEPLRRPGWWQRALTLPLLGLAPLCLCGFLLTVGRLSRPLGAGPLPAVGAVFGSLTVLWLLTWAPLTWTYRVVGPGRPSWRAAFAGALCGGAFVSGFLHGFVVFLAVPVDLGRPFGGLTAVGVVTGLLLWVWVVHAVVCVGYALVWAVDARLRGTMPAAGDRAHAAALAAASFQTPTSASS